MSNQNTSLRRPFISEIKNAVMFSELLKKNPGLLIIKLGANWCGPCKKIESRVFEWLNHMPNNVQSVILDIDVSFEFYAFLKSRRMVNGIPAILCYNQGNLNYIPDDTVVGALPKEVDLFFQRCYNKANSIITHTESNPTLDTV